MSLAAIIAAMCIGIVIGVLSSYRSQAENDERWRRGIHDLGEAVSQGLGAEQKDDL
jgi:hypothetical protein